MIRLLIPALFLSAALSPPSLRLIAVVDRIEGEVAVLEWSAGVYADLPATFLPHNTREGDRIELDILPAGDGLAHARNATTLDLPGRTTPPTLALPEPTRLTLGQPYTIQFNTLFAAPGPVDRKNSSPEEDLSHELEL